jgi:hypothetical protein
MSGLAAARSAGGKQAVRRAALNDAARALRTLRRQHVVPADAMTELLEGHIAALRGDGETSVECYRKAQRGFDGADMALYAAVSRRHLGEQLGGDEGRALVLRADSALRAEGVREPVSFSLLW